MLVTWKIQHRLAQILMPAPAVPLPIRKSRRGFAQMIMPAPAVPLPIRKSRRGFAQMIMPAPTVSFVASSISIRLPVFLFIL
jgi:hypothetical protein